MSTNYYTVSNGLLPSLQLRGYLPNASAQVGLTNADFLRLATEECRTYIGSILKSVREELLIASVDVAVTNGTVQVPYRAAGSALRVVSAINAQGVAVPLDRVEPENAYLYSGSGASFPVGFVLQGSKVIFLPSVGSFTARITYQFRPNRLVLESAVAQISNVVLEPVSGGSVLTLSSVPSTFTSNATYDIVRGVPGFENPAIDLSATIVGSSFTFTTLDPTTVAIGDYVTLAGETPIPQIPVECQDLLSARVAVKIAEAKNDNALANLVTQLDRMEKSVLTLLSPRTTGAPRKIINFNGPGWGRR